jgi:hypothetical protein
MSVEQIEEQIRQLQTSDLLQLTEWFNGYLLTRLPSSPAGEGADWPESPELVAELERRLAEFKADPSIATPFEPDYFNHLKEQLADERAQKASAR